MTEKWDINTLGYFSGSCTSVNDSIYQIMMGFSPNSSTVKLCTKLNMACTHSFLKSEHCERGSSYIQVNTAVFAAAIIHTCTQSETKAKSVTICDWSGQANEPHLKGMLWSVGLRLYLAKKYLLSNRYETKVLLQIPLIHIPVPVLSD